MKRIGLVGGILALTLMFGAECIGCTCMARPSVLDEFERSEDVFVAKVFSFVAVPEGRFDGGITGRARMLVRRVYKGELKPGVEVEFIQGSGADCVLTYGEESIGSEMLIYTTASRGVRAISICGRTTDVSQADDDLRYLDNLAWTKGKTRISGSVSFGYFGEAPPDQTVAGKKIKIVGGKRTFVATTDENGVYEIYDVPPGVYYLEPEVPFGWKLNEYMLDKTMMGSSNSLTREYGEYFEKKDARVNRFPIRVVAGRHVSFDLMYEQDNAIRGRLMGPDAKPIQGVCVHAVPANREESLYGFTGCSDKEGNFEITGLVHPEYILVINGDEELSGRAPIPKTFFPGVLERAKAQIIKIGPGAKPTLRDFRVPKVLDTISLRGVLLYSDGNPVATRKVQFVLDDPSAGPKISEISLYDYTESDGTFELRLLRGRSGRIRGEFYRGRADLDVCPDLRKSVLVESTVPDHMITTATDWIEVKADSDLKGIRVIFPFNECVKD